MNATNDDKTVAIISYITLFGWIIATVLHNNNKTELGAFHIRQTLGLYLTGIILWWIPYWLDFKHRGFYFLAHRIDQCNSG